MLMQFILEKQRKSRKESNSNDVKEHLIEETHIETTINMKLKSVKPIVIGLCIVLLIPTFTIICYLIYLYNPNISSEPGRTPQGLTIINFISTLTLVIGEITAGLLIGITLIYKAIQFKQKKQMIILGIFWIIWLIFSPLSELTKLIIINKLVYYTEYDITFSWTYIIRGSIIGNVFQILSVLRASFTSLILFFTAKILTSMKMLKAKVMLEIYSIALWLLYDLAFISLQLDLTIPGLGLIPGFLGILLFLFTIIPSAGILYFLQPLVIITVILLVRDFRDNLRDTSINQKQSSEITTSFDQKI